MKLHAFVDETVGIFNNYAAMKKSESTIQQYDFFLYVRNMFLLYTF